MSSPKITRMFGFFVCARDCNGNMQTAMQQTANEIPTLENIPDLRMVMPGEASIRTTYLMITMDEADEGEAHNLSEELVEGLLGDTRMSTSLSMNIPCSSRSAGANCRAGSCVPT